MCDPVHGKGHVPLGTGADGWASADPAHQDPAAQEITQLLLLEIPLPVETKRRHEGHK